MALFDINVGMDFEKLGLFYLGRQVDPRPAQTTDVPLLYDASDLVTHAVILGMTGSGKTGLGIGLIEEAAIDGVPVLAIDPKGDLSNLLLTFPELQSVGVCAVGEPRRSAAAGRQRRGVCRTRSRALEGGLAEWGQSGRPHRATAQGRRLQRLHAGQPSGAAALDPADLPGAAAAIASDPELLAERASAAATSVLTLAGIDAEPLRTREHILISTLLSEAWQQQQVARSCRRSSRKCRRRPFSASASSSSTASIPPPIDSSSRPISTGCWPRPTSRCGSKAIRSTSTRCSTPPQGQPRVSVLSIAHLDDRERMFFVVAAAQRGRGWMRVQRGTSTLRAMVYIDEMMGYLPPVAMPPSKPPLLTLLKQARAFGLGMTLATQNPVDLDYKALSNAGTWFLGRLQTERDKARLLDGLEGANAASGHGFDRATTDRTSVEPRKAHVPAAQRARQPAGAVQDALDAVVPARPAGAGGAGAAGGRRPAAPRCLGCRGAWCRRCRCRRCWCRRSRCWQQCWTVGTTGTSAPHAPQAPAPQAPQAPPAPQAPSSVQRPLLDPAIPQFFAPGTALPLGAGAPWRGARRLLRRQASMSTRSATSSSSHHSSTGPVPVDWEHAEPAAFTIDELDAANRSRPPRSSPLPGGRVHAEEVRAVDARTSRSGLAGRRRSSCREARGRNSSRAMDESERDFRIRLQTSLREQRDAELARVRERYARGSRPPRTV